jgi:hypothetical protein
VGASVNEGGRTSGDLGARGVPARPGARPPSGGGAWFRCRCWHRLRLRCHRLGRSRRWAVGAAEAELLEPRREAPGRWPYEVPVHVNPGDQARPGAPWPSACRLRVAGRVVGSSRAGGSPHGRAGRVEDVRAGQQAREHSERRPRRSVQVELADPGGAQFARRANVLAPSE